MVSVQPFAIYDCALARRAAGLTCEHLRELLLAVRSVSEGVLEHHLFRSPLEDHFELYEFPNDLARWCWDGLGDRVLAEQIGLVDPYQYGSIAALRADLANLIEERLWALDRVPWCRPGRELHLVESRLIVHDTGERADSPVALADAVAKMSPRSLFYHVHEGRRRSRGASDDFSAWLEQEGAHAALASRLRAVDFYFLNLNQLRQEILRAFQQYMPERQVNA